MALVGCTRQDGPAASSSALAATPKTANTPAPADTPALPAPTAALPAPTATPTGPLAPELSGGGAWLNSPPLTLEGLRGKIVLVQFWTYGCYNCRNTLPYVQGWWNAYRDQGLVIIGVHTPEFASEHELARVQQATERLGVTWPVVQDNEWAIWRAYQNRYWPRLYLVDHDGRVIYNHIGEGAYEETARRIEQALDAAKAAEGTRAASSQ
jgi:thiol-disulfide isomerase/thioredoxin